MWFNSQAAERGALAEASPNLHRWRTQRSLPALQPAEPGRPGRSLRSAACYGVLLMLSTHGRASSWGLWPILHLSRLESFLCGRTGATSWIALALCVHVAKP